MEKFFSCDWGTSSFRLRLIDVKNLSVITIEDTSQGIAETFRLWKQQVEVERMDFFRNYLHERIRAIERKLDSPLTNVPIVMSGMASSNIGLFELPYKKIPFDTDGSDLINKSIAATDTFPHDLLIISGANTSNDAMRGEETQLVGTFKSAGKTIYIFPGTHSKHIFTESGMVVDCKTFMTGEFFEMLSQKSILSASVSANKSFDRYAGSFDSGVRIGAGSNLLNAAFHVRTNSLFEKLSKEENFYYLSGLLIGYELKEILTRNSSNITLVSNRTQADFYTRAFGLLDKHRQLSFVDIETATIVGQLRIAIKGGFI